MPGFQSCFISDNIGFCACDGVTAIAATNRARSFVDYVETGLHRLVVGDTFGVGATYDANDCFGQHYGSFFDDFVVANDINDGRRGYESDAVERLLWECDVGDFDNTFCAEFVATQVVADSELLRERLYAEYFDAFKKRFGRDMVDDGAVLQGGDCQRCFSSGHILLDRDINLQSVANKRLAHIQAVLGLFEIVGFGVVVDVGRDFVDARQRVEYAQVVARIIEHCVAQGVEVFDALILGEVGESFTLHARHINNVGGVDNLLREVGVTLVADALLVAKLEIFFWHLEFVAGYEIEIGFEIFHSHNQRMDGAAIFQVADEGDSEVVEPPLSFVD